MLNSIPRLDIFLRAWRYRLRVERHEIQFMLRHVRRGQTVVDVGAHKGAYTYWLQRRVGRTGRVFAFEPQPEPAHYLKAWVRIAGLPHVTVVASAVSRNPGTMPLTREGCSASPGARLLAASSPRPKPTPTHETFNVPVTSLDHFFTAHPSSRPIHFIKCDAEGHELDVFRGAESILRRDRPLLLFECESRHHGGASILPVFQYLQQLGYEGFYFHRNRLPALAAHPDHFQWNMVQGNYVNNFAFLPLRAAA